MTNKRLLKLVRDYAEQLDGAADETAKIESEADTGSMRVAQVLADLYADKSWVDELEPPKKAMHAGRPVLADSRNRFSRWINQETGLLERWVYRLLDAHDLTTNYLAQGQVIQPTHERPLRLLRSRLERKGRGDDIPKVWNAAVTASGGAEPTSAAVAAAIREHMAKFSPAEKRAMSKQAEINRERARAIAAISWLIEHHARDTAKKVLTEMAQLYNNTAD